MKNNNKLTFLWREPYIDYLWATQTTAKNYFLHSGILVYNNGILSAFATASEFKRIKQQQNILLDKNNLAELKNKFTDIKRKIETFYEKFRRQKLKSTSDDLLIKFYQKIINLYGIFIKTYFWTEPHCVKNIELEVNKIIKKISVKDKNKILANILSDKRTIKKYKLERYINLFDTVIEISKIRFSAKTITNKLSDCIEKLLFETARRTNYAINQISSMSFNELKKIFIKQPVNLYLVNRRVKKFGIKVISNGNNIKIIDLNDKEIAKIEKMDTVFSNEIRGNSVFSGKVKGFVKIANKLYDEEDYEKFIFSLKNDDILVASMTHPNLSAAFNIVAGVITDEGGLMSHAALVSREKKTPCVVGTKNATKILKNGQKIYLDADNGIITIIK
ncbi:MAG: hypothetical protein LBD88_05235 [Candidatus Peribacteria bacterium]|jgi:phosphohistidine swiveling domain-containing protein|nr:hypothetical protein [Candidatus Peribacteria bacterium]